MATSDFIPMLAIPKKAGVMELVLISSPWWGSPRSRGDVAKLLVPARRLKMGGAQVQSLTPTPPQHFGPLKRVGEGTKKPPPSSSHRGV